MADLINTILVPDFICKLDKCVHFTIVAFGTKMLQYCTKVIQIVSPDINPSDISVTFRIQCPIEIAKQIYQDM